jgi:quercetin dioxygenase-like cupin family protein
MSETPNSKGSLFSFKVASIAFTALIATIPFLVTIIGSATSSTHPPVAEAAIDVKHGSERLKSLVQNDQSIQNEGIGMVRSHQPHEAVFRSVLPEDVEWKTFPAFPPSVRLAILVGNPSEPGPYVIRVKVPSGVKLMPHQHPEDRIYTVMSGVFYIGLGDKFDGDKVEAYPPGSVVVLPGNTPHFHWAKSGEYVTQVTAIGPLGLEYMNPGDDPRG